MIPEYKAFAIDADKFQFVLEFDGITTQINSINFVDNEEGTDQMVINYIILEGEANDLKQHENIIGDIIEGMITKELESDNDRPS